MLSDPLGGFLPPNVTAPEGDGFVTYFVRSRSDLPTATRLDAQARIVFDTNDPVDTPAIFNTIDAGPPTSSVNPLVAVIQTESFPLSWSASDDADGGACIEMAGGVRLQFAAPLRTYRSTYAVGALRAAILEEDLKEIERAGGAPGEYHHALWRSASGVNVRSLSESSARFLAAVLAGADGAAALSAAAGAQQSAEQIASALASEILPAGFVRIGKARVPERSEPN